MPQTQITNCLQKLKADREPQEKLADVLLGKIGRLDIYPREKKVEELEFENISRKLEMTNIEWSEKQKVDCFLRHMAIPFENIEIRGESLRN